MKCPSHLAIQREPKTEINQQNAIKYCLKYGFEEGICRPPFGLQTSCTNLVNHRFSNSTVMLTIFVSKLCPFFTLASLLTLPIFHSLKILKAHLVELWVDVGTLSSSSFLSVLFHSFNGLKTPFSWQHLGVQFSKPLDCLMFKSSQIANNLHNCSSPSIVIWLLLFGNFQNNHVLKQKYFN